MPRPVEVPLRYTVDQQSADNAKRSLDQIRERVDKLDDAVTNLNQLEGAIDDIFSRVGAGALAIFAPSILAANNYATSVENVNASTQQWLDTQARLQEQQQRFGAIAVEAIQPYYSLLADIVEELNSIDPAILSAGIQAAGLVAGAATILLLGAQVTRMVSAVYDLTSAIIKLQAAGGLQGAAATGAVRGAVGLGAIGVGTVLGVGAVRGIGAATGDERLAEYGFDDLFETLKQILFIVGAGFIEFSEALAKGIVALRFALEAGVLKLEQGLDGVESKLRDKFEDIVNILEGALIGLQKFVLDIPGVGELAKALGLDEDDVNRRQRELEARRNGGRNPFLAVRTALTGDAPIDEFAARAEDLARRYEEAIQGTENNSENLKRNFADVLGYGEDTAEAMEDARDAARGFAALSEEQQRSILDNFAALLDDLEQAEAEFVAERKRKIEQFYDDEFEIAEQYYADREQAETDFYAALKSAAAKFAAGQKAERAAFYARSIQDQQRFGAEQLKAAQAFEVKQAKQRADFAAEQERAERDFQTKQRRAKEDHERSLLESAASLDFAAIAKERARFDTQQRREQEDFATQQTDRQKQFDERLDQERKEFEALQKERQTQADERRKDEQKAFEERLKEAKDAFSEQQAAQRTNFEKQQQQADDAFRDAQAQRQQDFDEQLADERAAFDARKAEQKAAFEDELNALIEHNNMTELEMQRHYDELERQLLEFANLTGGTSGGATAPASRAASAASAAPSGVSAAMSRGLSGGRLAGASSTAINNSRTVGDVNPTLVIEGGSQLNERQLRKVIRSTFIELMNEAGA